MITPRGRQPQREQQSKNFQGQTAADEQDHQPEGDRQHLLQQTDHPTADEVYLRAKSAMPELSMATVYNTLDALVKCGLIKQVNVERTASRYCSNMNEHCHFICEECGSIQDVDFKKDKGKLPLKLPRNLVPTQVDISLRGRCAMCRPLEVPKPKSKLKRGAKDR